MTVSRSHGEPRAASGRPPRARVRAWRAEVSAARSTCSRFDADSASLDDLAAVAPTLIDSVYSRDCERILDSLAEADFDERPRLAMAKGRLCFLRGDQAGASTFVSKALGAARADTPLLARAIWELGCIALGDNNMSTAEVTLQLGVGMLGDVAARAPDLLHLEALLAERRFDRELAIRKYREAIALADEGLTSLTRVIALRNLAGALAQDDPRDASGLCALGLVLIDGDLLDERSRPAVENALAYTLLADGRVEEGRRRAEAAASDARRLGHWLVECYGLFNYAIALELSGQLGEAQAILNNALRLSTENRFSDLARWIRLRLAWLTLKADGSIPAIGELEPGLADAAGDEFSASVSTFAAIVAYRSGDAPHAIQELQPLVHRYLALSDWSTTFALLLWLACAHESVGERKAARAAVEAALRTGRTHDLRMSPNWWSDDVVRIAKKLAPAQDAAYAETLSAESGSVGQAVAMRVTVSVDGNVLIDGTPLPDECWRTGRTGRWVLRRLFKSLAAAYPVGVRRDELADLLWPESDGDRARQNLYAALNDLRRLVGSVPGLSIATDKGRYRLSAPSHVLFERTTRSDQPVVRNDQ